MDTSEKYIRMCEKATEIQSLFEPKNGDWYVVDYTVTNWNNGLEVRIAFNGEFTIQENFEEIKKNNYRIVDGKKEEMGDAKVFWLPRQDQLQEMVYNLYTEGKEGDPVPRVEGKHTVLCPNTILCEIFEFSEDDCEMGLKTIEQVWIAFVMYEKYEKKWNGKDWIKLEE